MRGGSDGGERDIYYGVAAGEGVYEGGDEGLFGGEMVGEFAEEIRVGAAVSVGRCFFWHE